MSGADAVAAERAFWALVDRPDETVKLFAKNVQPRRAGPVDAERVARLIGELDDEKFTAREAAERQLAALGFGAQPHLKKALTSEASAEKRRRLTKLLDRLADDDASVLRHRRLVGVLRQFDTPAAHDLLREWAKAATDSLADLAAEALK